MNQSNKSLCRCNVHTHWGTRVCTEQKYMLWLVVHWNVNGDFVWSAAGQSMLMAETQVFVLGSYVSIPFTVLISFRFTNSFLILITICTLGIQLSCTPAYIISFPRSERREVDCAEQCSHKRQIIFGITTSYVSYYWQPDLVLLTVYLNKHIRKFCRDSQIARTGCHGLS